MTLSPSSVALQHAVRPPGSYRRPFHESNDTQRRQQREDLDQRSKVIDTAEWISNLGNTRYPVKIHFPSTDPARDVSAPLQDSSYSCQRSVVSSSTSTNAIDIERKRIVSCRMISFNRQQNALGCKRSIDIKRVSLNCTYVIRFLIEPRTSHGYELRLAHGSAEYVVGSEWRWRSIAHQSTAQRSQCVRKQSTKMGTCLCHSQDYEITFTSRT